MRRRDVIRPGGALMDFGVTAGCSGGESNGSGPDDSSEADPPLAFDRLEFATEEPPGYCQYEAQFDATYTPGDTVWADGEPTGVTVESVAGGGPTFELLLEVSVTLSDGREWDIGSRTHSQEVGDPEAVEDLFAKPRIDVSDAAETGAYEAVIALRDELDGDTVTESLGFEVAE